VFRKKLIQTQEKNGKIISYKIINKNDRYILVEILFILMSNYFAIR